MKRLYYAIGTVCMLFILGVGVLSVGNYFEPVYQEKNYSSIYNASQRADLSAQYHFMMRKNLNGVIDQQEVFAARRAVENISTQKNAASNLYWYELGPNFVGGRSRALIQDNQPGNESILYVGSVAGGVFISFNGGEQWYGYSSNMTTLNIGDLAQTANGTLFVGTGPGHDGGFGGGPSSSNGFMGDGLFRREVDVNGNHTFTRLIGPNGKNPSDQWAIINRMMAHPTDPNKLYIGTGNGLMVTTNALASPSEVAFFKTLEVSPGVFANGAIDDIQISNDGSTIFVALGGRIFKLNDAGGSNISIVSTIDLPGTGTVDRIALAMAPSDNNVIYAAMAASGSSDCVYGIYQSKDGGDNWNLIGPGGGSFDPYISLACQGGWDNCAAVSPTDPGKLIVGGVGLYQWTESKTAPGTGGWDRIALQFGGSLVDTNYVHADKHRILFTDSNTIYIASDGGVGKSLDGGKTWGQNNNGYNVTQFYSVDAAFGVDYDSLGLTSEQVMGGTQDNGTQLIGLNPTRPDIAQEIRGGDGFDCNFSNLASLAFTSVYFGAIERINYFGAGGGFFDAELNELCMDRCGPFYTRFTYWETPNASHTFDSIKYFSRDTVNTILAGDTVIYPSVLGGVPMYWPTPKDLNFGDSVMMPDFAQSKFAFATGSEGQSTKIYLTKDASNLTTINPRWDLVADNGSSTYPDPITQNVFKMVFSSDGNQLFLGTTGGSIYRIDNLNQGYDSLTLDIRSPLSVVTCTRLGGVSASYISGLSVDPNDPNNIVFTAPGYGGTQKIWRATNAATCGSNELNTLPIQGDFPQGVPVYSCLIADHDENTVIIGTEFGIYTTDNAFSGGQVIWSPALGMSKVAVYDLVQQTNQYLYGTRQPVIENVHYRKVYAGTHGRGFWSTSDLVGIDDDKNDKPVVKKEAQIQFKIYPNPLNTSGFMEVTLPSDRRVEVDIYDLSGKKISTIESGVLLKGKNKLQFDVSGLTSGTYIAALKSGDELKVSKFVVLK